MHQRQAEQRCSGCGIPDSNGGLVAEQSQMRLFFRLAHHRAAMPPANPKAKMTQNQSTAKSARTRNGLLFNSASPCSRKPAGRPRKTSTRCRRPAQGKPKHVHPALRSRASDLFFNPAQPENDSKSPTTDPKIAPSNPDQTSTCGRRTAFGCRPDCGSFGGNCQLPAAPPSTPSVNA